MLRYNLGQVARALFLYESFQITHECISVAPSISDYSIQRDGAEICEIYKNKHYVEVVSVCCHSRPIAIRKS